MTSAHPENQDASREDGFALAVVLWFLLFAAAVIAPFAVAAQTGRWIAANTHEKEKLDLLADGVATLVSLRLADPEAVAFLRAALPFNSSPASCLVGTYWAEIRVQEQAGLVDLNAADETLLAAGLRALGVASAEVPPVVRAINAFRSPEPESPGGGPQASILGGRKGARFESVIEVTDIKPLERMDPAELRRVFTVHSRQAAVRLASAPQPLAVALAGAEAGFGLIRDKVEGTPTAFTIEVTVRAIGTGIRGYSGFLAEPSGPPAFIFRRIEPLPEARPLEIEASPASSVGGCPAAVQDDLASMMAGLPA